MHLRLFAFLAIAAVISSIQSRAATPALTTLVSFNGFDGFDPLAALIIDANGNLFGTTFAGGANIDGGTAFEIIKTASGYASTPTILYNFCTQAGCTDGGSPQASLITDANGNLFGTTFAGGTNLEGTVFEIIKTASGYASTPTILYNFCTQAGCTDGAYPSAGLIIDANGNLLGTTLEGGANNAGTVFEISKTASGYASTPTILYNFCTQAGCTDGANPFASLIVDANGNLFGTTAVGGNSNCSPNYTCGTVFEIAKSANGYAGTPTTLVKFNYADGSEPQASLIVDAVGNLFGTTVVGGDLSCTDGCGTVFEIAKSANGYAGTPTTLVKFNYADGALPYAGLTADAKGNLFGTTSRGGANGNGAYGTVFEITGSGFVPPPLLAGTPGKPNCHGKSVSAVAQQYGGLAAAATVLGYSNVQVLQNNIDVYCAG
jgi:hypothetical protein